MKKGILLLLVCFNLHVFAQEQTEKKTSKEEVAKKTSKEEEKEDGVIKEGIIVTSLTMSSKNTLINNQLAMLGDMSATVYFKGNKSRTEMKNLMTGENVTIVDNDSLKMVSLLNNPMMGKKYREENVKVSKEDLKNVRILQRRDTKKILDYVCKGYDIVIKKERLEFKMTMYTTDKIKVPTQNTVMLGDKFKGFPMFLTMNVNQGGVVVQIKMEATDIKEEKVADDKFSLKIPEGYSKMELPKAPTAK